MVPIFMLETVNPVNIFTYNGYDLDVRVVYPFQMDDMEMALTHKLEPFYIYFTDTMTEV